MTKTPPPIPDANTPAPAPGHRHRFIIPARYEFNGYKPRYDGSGHVTIAPSFMTLVSLLCACGKEKEL